ncbi:ribosomal protein L7/L12 [Kitasatospora albolonga]|uniref:ribosomal protein L7/L12 n=1 Tax=Kitasatospora albolonga TaxID=68173 RepID=UPI0031E761C9
MTDETVYATLVCDDVPHDLVLLDVGPAPLAVAKAYQLMTGLGLWRAKQAVTAPPPVLLLECLLEEDAHALAARLTEAGASAAAVLSTRGRDAALVTAAAAPPRSRPGP